MSFDFSLLKSMSSIDSDLSEINKQLEEKFKNHNKNKKKEEIKNLIKKQKEINNSYQEIYRNETKKLIQFKTTKDNTLTTESSLNNKKLDKFINKKLSNSIPQDINNNIKEEKDEDINFLRKVIKNHNFNNNKTIKNSLKLNDLRKYIIKIQKSIKDGEELLLNKNISDFMKDISDLIARFSFIIFIFLKNNRFEQAKIIFLLMLKENKKYLEHIEIKIIESYYTSKDFPKEIYELLRIYSFIIKYSQFFNMTNNCNFFIGHYFEIIYYIYNWFKYNDYSGVMMINIKNQMNLWLSLALHNASYFSILHYFPISLSINLNKHIIDIYQDCNENHLPIREKSFLTKVLYNLSLSYYLNGQNEKALNYLEDAKDRILNNGDNDDNFYFRNSIFYKNLKKKKSIFHNNDYLSTNIEDEGNRLSTANSFSESVNNKNINDLDSFDKIVEEKKIEETFSKDNINLEDIKLLINYGFKSGLMTEKKNESSNQINNSPKYTLNKRISIPKYYKNPLLRKIELLTSEIELDKKNYKSAYEHILKVFYILLLIKLGKKTEEYFDLNKAQKKMEKYLILIEKLKEKEIGNKNEEKSENISFENSLEPSLSTNNDDSFQEKYKEDLGDIILNKYNLILYLNKQKEQKNSSKLALFCGEKELDIKMLKDLEKFFIFLCTLSLFQINVLNETQPDSWKRYDLPILFSSQFKDCLSKNQRIGLDNLQTMDLNRSDILKNSSGLIMPNNLNINIIKEKDIEKSKRRKIIKFINKFDEENVNDNKITRTKEFKLYLKIINSGKLNKDTKDFFKNNKDLVLKVLKQAKNIKTEDIIESPNLIIEPVKIYKKQRKKYFSKLNLKNRYEILNNKNNFNYRNNNSNLRMSTTGIEIFKSKLKLQQKTEFDSKLEKINNNDTFYRLSCIKGKRHKSKLGEIFNLQFDDNKPKKQDEKDYNDNYNDFQISVESSLKEEN